MKLNRLRFVRRQKPGVITHGASDAHVKAFLSRQVAFARDNWLLAVMFLLALGAITMLFQPTRAATITSTKVWDAAEDFSPATKTGVTVTSTGQVTLTPTSEVVSLLPVYRFNNTITGDHFYTTSEAERSALSSRTSWRYEGIGFSAYASCAGKSPIYRFVAPGLRNSHFYTASEGEKNLLQRTGSSWTYEGVGFCGDTLSTSTNRPVHRYRLASFPAHHFYTAGASEKTLLDATGSGWIYEGVGWYTPGSVSQITYPESGTLALSFTTPQSVNWTQLTAVKSTPANTSLAFEARSSTDGTNYSSWNQDVTKLPQGRYLQIRIGFATSQQLVTPSLDKLTLTYTYDDGQTPPPPPPPPPPATVSIDSNPVSIASGQSSRLSWTSTNATSCTASNGWSGSRPTSGTEQTSNLTSSRTFTLTCTGAGGSDSDSVTVAVAQPPPPPPPPGPGGLTSPYGVYPNCIAPAVGLETHSWWHETGEHSPRHLHIATCLPNARDTTGTQVKVSGVLPAVLRIISFNSPGYINQARYAWESDVITSHRFDPRLQCQATPDEHKECTWYVAMGIDTDRMRVSGMDELRLTPNMQHDDLGTRQYLSLNFQLHRGGSGNYRSSPALISRGWYTGLDYINVTWNNYMSLFTNLNQTMPVVKGTIDVNVSHASCSGSGVSDSQGFIDADFHAAQRGRIPAPTPFYKFSGCHSGTVRLDTTKLSNGVHTVYLQTQERDLRGLNAGAGKYFINVQN